jgi:hypothetical protein
MYFTMKAYAGTDVDPHFFLQHYLEASDQLHILAALHSEKCPKYPLDRRLDRPQTLYGR